ncbi:two-component system response regulator [Nostoc sp. CENA543]|uniref:response regulator n=1 Tax=Nostoc sp. CENA543 TaxID=1869241 RepID=UPI000CA2197F|nr:response regulator [Nostoc sp. CENA543]AUT03233.1 two-component system response regulator [Nostoc sp. CENA543]
MFNNSLLQPHDSCCQKIKRILIVEDDKINRMLLSDYLKYFGYNVLSFPDGENFIFNIKSFNPDLILLDLKLPDIDGYYLLQQVKQHPSCHNIPIIVVSGFAFEIDKEKAIKLGASDYFVKPINLNLLTIAIAKELAYAHI